uniref:ABM domain-containing protein n=1 Tax=Physcomitrium patens TaxID=3218 RepID=A0A7I4F6B0_PHYPA
MAGFCVQARAVLAAEKSSYVVGSTRGCSSSGSSPASNAGIRWAPKTPGGMQKMMAERKGHLGTRVVLVETAAVVTKQRATGLVVEAAKRISTGRSYALSSTLKIEAGKEEEATALCKSIVEWALEKMNDRRSGIQGFECNVDAFDKNTFHFWEIYESFVAMNDIRASPEHTKFVMDVRPLLTDPIALAAYEYKDGQIGHMMNPIGKNSPLAVLVTPGSIRCCSYILFPEFS